MASDKPRGALAVVLMVLYFDLVGFSIVFPMLAELLSFYEDAGGALTWLDDAVAAVFHDAGPGQRAALFGGVLSSLYSLLQFVIIPVWGRLSDRLGRRPVLLFSVCLNFAGYVAWVFAGSFEFFVVSRILTGLGSGNISVASAAVADLSTPENRARTMGLMGAAIGLGFITGPALGSAWALMPRLGDGGAALALNPFSFPAAIAAALTLLNLFFILTRLQETLPEALRGRGEVTRSADVRRLFSASLGSRMRRLNGAYLFFMLAFAGFEATLVFLASDVLAWGPAQVGVCMVWLGLLSATVQGGFVRRLVPRFGEQRLATAGLVMLIPGFALTALVAWHRDAALLWIGVSMLAIGVGLFSPTIATLVSLSATPERQGRAMGAYRSVGALGRALGPLMAAMLYFRIGPGAPYAAGALLVLAPAAMIARLPDNPTS